MSADGGSWDRAEFSELHICIPDNGFRNRKAKALTSSARSIDKGIYPDEASVAIDERASAVAWIDRRVGLHVYHGTICVRLPAESADNSLGHGVNEPLRRSDRDHSLTQLYLIVRRERDEGQIFLFDLDDCEIGIAIRTDERRIIDMFPVGKNGAACDQFDGRRRKSHSDTYGSGNDVIVGDYVSIRINNHAGAQGALALKVLRVFAALGVLRHAVTGDIDLNNGPHRALSNLIEGLIVFLQNGRSGCVRRRALRFLLSAE